MPDFSSIYRSERSCANAKYGCLMTFINFVILVILIGIPGEFLSGLEPRYMASLYAIYYLGFGAVCGLIYHRMEKLPWFWLSLVIFFWTYLTFAKYLINTTLVFLLASIMVYTLLSLIGINLTIFAKPRRAKRWFLLVAAVIILIAIYPFQINVNHQDQAVNNGYPYSSIEESKHAHCLSEIVRLHPAHLKVLNTDINIKQCWIEGSTLLSYDSRFYKQHALYGPYYLCITLNNTSSDLQGKRITFSFKEDSYTIMTNKSIRGAVVYRIPIEVKLGKAPLYIGVERDNMDDAQKETAKLWLELSPKDNR